MSKILLSSTGTPYITIIDSAGKWWNNTEFVDFEAANWITYIITATRYGTSDIWYTQFPTTIGIGIYNIFQFRIEIIDPSQTDPAEASATLSWDGNKLSNGLDTSGIREAIGMAEPNLDEQLNEILNSGISSEAIQEIVNYLNERSTRVVLGPCERQVRNFKLPQ